MLRNKIVEPWKKISVVCAVYLFISMLVLFVARSDGTIPYWPIQAILGPIWHLSAFVAIMHRPFDYLDNVTRVKGEDIFLSSISFCIWFFGLSLLVLWLLPFRRRRRQLLLLFLVIFWLVVGGFNIYLYGLFTV